MHTVKVVIIGQDPYHNHNQAHGLCFSVRAPVRAPPSLVNIYKGIKVDYPDFEAPPDKGGLLTPWAERGVLMLNTCLTVRAHQANSHSNKGWEKFTQKVIDVVARVRTNGVVFLAWGRPAGMRVAKINKDKHCILQSVHPSPLSAHHGFVSIPFLRYGTCLLILCSSRTDISRSAMTGLPRDMAQTKPLTGAYYRPKKPPRPLLASQTRKILPSWSTSTQLSLSLQRLRLRPRQSQQQSMNLTTMMLLKPWSRLRQSVLLQILLSSFLSVFC